MSDLLSGLSGYIWGNNLFGVTGILVPLLLGVGAFLTIVFRGFQFRELGSALHLALIKRREDTEEGDISHFRALTTALSGTLGTGNIGGVGAAILIGGPGALFWMWVTALLGMATKYAEAVLGVKYRETDAVGEQAGGPMFYLTRGIGGPFGRVLGTSFAIFAAIAAFGIGNAVQSFETSAAIEGAFGIPLWVTGLVLTIGAGAVILGGIQRIGLFTSIFVPFMAVLYMVFATLVILLNITNLPSAVGVVIAGAFSPSSVLGGAAGVGFAAVLSAGVARGIFSNESGLGTGGIAAASAQTTSPVRQGAVSMTQTFIDTIVVCSFTGLAIVSTGVWSNGETYGGSGARLTQVAFSEALGGIGPIFLAIGLALFAFSTLITWAYYGERNMVYLFGRGGVFPYRLAFIAVIFIGAVYGSTEESALSPVWLFADVMNGLMALPNLIGLIFLAGVVWNETRNYFRTTGGVLEADIEGSGEPRVR